MALFDRTTINNAVETGPHASRSDVDKSFLTDILADVAKGIFSSFGNTYPELFWDTTRIAFAWGQGGATAPDIYMQRASASMLEVKNAANNAWLGVRVDDLETTRITSRTTNTIPNGALEIEGYAGGADVNEGIRFGGDCEPSASQNAYGVVFGSSMTEAASGSHSQFVGVRIEAPVITGGAATLDNAASLYVVGEPSGATNNYAAWIASGTFRVDDNYALGGGASATLGTIGGSGPATAAQAQWLKINIDGTDHWVPVWT